MCLLIQLCEGTKLTTFELCKFERQRSTFQQIMSNVENSELDDLRLLEGLSLQDIEELSNAIDPEVSQIEYSSTVLNILATL